MVKENPSRGAPRIHGELLKLGLNVSERTVSRHIRRLSNTCRARKLWATFLRNHREVIAAMDFFTVPALTFGVLYWNPSTRIPRRESFDDGQRAFTSRPIIASSSSMRKSVRCSRLLPGSGSR